jgi:hypothetical protein
MKCAAWRNSSSALRFSRLLRAACVGLGMLALANAAFAATFYKWTDKDGTVHYGDAPPKGFTGTVSRIDVDPEAHSVAPAVKPVEKAVPLEPGAAPQAPAEPDLLTQRRQTRARLEANLERARARLDLARKSLAEAGEPQPDEWQVTLGGPPGPGAQVPRSNCHKTQDGRTICPGRVPSAEYYSRVQQLEDQVKRAELAVEDAERAYRRGVD